MEPWVSSVKRGAAAQPRSFLPLPVSSSADAGVGGVPLHQHRFRVLSVTVSPALSSLPSASLHLHWELHHSSVLANLCLPPSDSGPSPAATRTTIASHELSFLSFPAEPPPQTAIASNAAFVFSSLLSGTTSDTSTTALHRKVPIPHRCT